MAAPPAQPTGIPPRYLKASYLANLEVLLAETRATPLFYFPGPIVFLILVLVVLGIYTATPSLHSLPFGLGTYVLDLLLLLLLVGIIWLLVRYLRWVSTLYAVTNQRVLVKRGILSRNFDEIPILQVRGVDVHQSILQRILGYGTIRVSSEGGRAIGNEDWQGIPHPFNFQKIIQNATVSRQNQPQPVYITSAPVQPTPGPGSVTPGSGTR
jgi:uncharacterized membrane protein YdbT with pleckstrin-like domain